MSPGHEFLRWPAARQLMHAGSSPLERSLHAVQASARIGELLAERAKQAGVPAVHWRRKHGQRYHGKIKELLQSMTAAGLPLN